VDGTLAHGRSYDLVSEDSTSLIELLAALREWIGFPKARRVVHIPAPFVSGLSRVADALGHLGWRSPLRRTAMQVLATGIDGNPEDWRDAGMPPCMNLREALDAVPPTLPDRVHARMALAMPIVVGVLALFWLLSGMMGVVSFDRAVDVLTVREMDPAFAALVVGAGSIADLALGAAVLVRRWARPAMLGMIGLSIGYLLAGSMWTPDLWLDPLGPFVKVLPTLVLGWVGWSMLEAR
ncbi:MAG: DoxX-like family protein, partial [Pseudomonadota bacterium]